MPSAADLLVEIETALTELRAKAITAKAAATGDAQQSISEMAANIEWALHNARTARDDITYMPDGGH